MEQYILKSALITEIENLLKPLKQRLERDKNDPWDSDIAVYKFGNQLIKNIDTLGVKKVDLELTVDDISSLRKIMYDYDMHLKNEKVYPYNDDFCYEVLKRFKAQKG